jgi:hypothetical protein
MIESALPCQSLMEEANLLTMLSQDRQTFFQPNRRRNNQTRPNQWKNRHRFEISSLEKLFALKANTA